MKVIAICNQKGGVGKTTTSNTLLAGLTERGYRVLGIDLDSQANLTSSLGVQSRRTSLGVLTGEVTAREAIVHTPTGDLIPGTPGLSNVGQLIDDIGKEYRLKDSLQELEGDYDYIVIDTPPALGLLTVNAMTASDYLVVPAQADLYSLQGMNELSRTVEAVQRHPNPGLKVAGILLTMYNPRTNITKEVTALIDRVADKLGTTVFNSKIRQSIKATELQFTQGGLFKYAPKATVTQDYNSFIDELLERV